MFASIFLIASLFLAQPFPPFGAEKAYEGVVVLAGDQIITGTFFFDEGKGFLYRKKKCGLEFFPPTSYNHFTLKEES